MKKVFNSKFFSYGLFWSWNLLYVILFVALEIEQGFAYRIIFDGVTGEAPVGFTISAILAYTIPLISIILAVTVLKKERTALVKLFYGAEVPLTLICLLRLSLLKELNPGTTHLFILLLAGMGTFLIELTRKKEPEGKKAAILSLILNTILLLIGVYIGLVLVFYLPPAIVGVFYLLREIEFSSIVRDGFLAILGTFFFLYSITLLLGLPLAMIYLYFKQFKTRFRRFSLRFSLKEAVLVSGLFIILNLLLFFFLNWYQPQEGLLVRLRNFKGTKEEIAAFSEDDTNIKKGLLNAYLAKYRYISEESKSTHMSEIYFEAFGGKRVNYALFDFSHNILLKPFLYAGESMWEDRNQAGIFYEKYFDASLYKEEREEIKNAFNSTWQREQAEAGLLDIGEEKVLVLEQNVQIKESGDLAEVEIYEVYQNQTFDQQEILYYFSLPDNAAITGMWISDEPGVKKYTYKLAPRGAAQQVYKREMVRRVDPSLLEQVGPNQYRLRAFPIEPKTRDWSSGSRRGYYDIKEGKKFYLWLKYTTLAGEDDSWPMPVVLQRRNVFCNGDTKFSINRQEGKKEEHADWLPLSVKSGNPIIRQKHIASVADGPAILATPSNTVANIEVPDNGSYAIVLDGTYSMKKKREELQKEWAWLERSGFFDKNQVDVFFTGSAPEKLNVKGLNFSGLNFFGNQNLLALLHQFDSLGSKTYDAVLFFTDQGDYEGSTDSIPSLSYPAPFYLIHVDKKLPYAYQDNLLETIEKSSGRSFTAIGDLFKYIQISEQNKDDSTFIGLKNGYLWRYDKEVAVTESPFHQLAARLYIKKNTPRKKEERLAAMDKIHEIAKKYSIVTPYSSMICLVNDRQIKNLEEAEKGEDRFERETESGKQGMPSSGLNFAEVSGTPEPEEWVLMILAGLMCLFLTVNKVKRLKFKF